MNLALVEKIADAVMYEGYLLYPYTETSVKNQQRWRFGTLYPPGFDTSEMQTECLALAGGECAIAVRVRFLQGDAERYIDAELTLPDAATHCSFEHDGLAGEMEIAARRTEGSLLSVTVRVRNTTVYEDWSRDAALAVSMISAHTILTIRGGEFVSLIDPPEQYREAALACRNVGTWPVLAGKEGERDTMLSSPIILYDYPQVAPESPGNLFDSTEIDEILTLRILTLSEEEKAQVRQGDERARQILERSEALPPEHLMKLHGALRGLHRHTVRVGDTVLLHPRRSADIMDIALAGKRAIVESVEQDFDGQVHLAVVLEDDPGRDLGMMRQPGHRFFFGLEEVEPVA